MWENTLGKCRQADSQVIMIVSSRFGKVQYKNAWAIKSNGNKIVQMVRKGAGKGDGATLSLSST